MATKKTETVETARMNVWQKLLAARIDFLREGVTKSGVNMHAEFKYFELYCPGRNKDFLDLQLPVCNKFPGGESGRQTYQP